MALPVFLGTFLIVFLVDFKKFFCNIIRNIVGNCYNKVLLISSWNTKKRNGLKSKLALVKSVSRKYNFMSEARIKELQQIQLKKSYESKCNWAVTAYNDWRAERLKTYNYDYPI